MARRLPRWVHVSAGVFLVADGVLGLFLLSRGWPSPDTFPSDRTQILGAISGLVCGPFMLWAALRWPDAMRAVSRPHEVLPGEVKPGMSTRKPVFRHPGAIIPLLMIIYVGVVNVLGLAFGALIILSGTSALAGSEALLRGVCNLFVIAVAYRLIRVAFQSAAPSRRSTSTPNAP